MNCGCEGGGFWDAWGEVDVKRVKASEDGGGRRDMVCVVGDVRIREFEDSELKLDDFFCVSAVNVWNGDVLVSEMLDCTNSNDGGDFFAGAFR